MRVSVNWLREFVDFDLDVEALAQRLTMLGLEIESIEWPGRGVSGIVIGRILEIARHPNADKLVVCKTDVGRAEPLQIVCGATNMRAGDLVPTALVGATLPGNLKIEKRKVRGTESQGMMCSASELGLGADHSGLLILHDNAPIGVDAVPYLGLDDAILEIEVTPNRGDWAGMIGVARELAASLETPLKLPATNLDESGEEASSISSVTIEDPEDCPRYVGRVLLNARQGVTPLWMVRRLLFGGMRPINPIVDVTNYVLLETGHPMHAFDIDKLKGRRIVVRKARTGERIQTLDGQARLLDDSMLVIADADRPVAIAGIMGGLESEVGEGTANVFLESAMFNPVSIRRTARKQGMNTEASARFQRGADPEMALMAANRAAGLIRQITGAAIARGVLDAYPRPARPRSIVLRYDRTRRLLGAPVAPEIQRSILERLAFGVTPNEGNSCTVLVPSWRHDCTQEADLIEEIARLYGYDNIPPTVPRVRKSDMVLAPEERAIRALKRHLVGVGLTEMMSLTFSSPEEHLAAGLGGAYTEMVTLENPLSETSRSLRTSLIPALLAAASLNARHLRRTIRMFELGPVFRLVERDALPTEELRLGVLLAGKRREQHWSDDGPNIDVFDLKGILEAIFAEFGVEAEWSEAEFGPFEPGFCGRVHVGGRHCGWFGKVRSDLLQRHDIAIPTYLAEIELAPILAGSRGIRCFAPISEFPPSLRDLAIVVNRDVPAQRIVRAVVDAGGAHLAEARIFDVYTGDQVPQGKKSLAFGLVFQAQDRTLTDADVQRAMDRILKRLEAEFGATLR